MPSLAVVDTNVPALGAQALRRNVLVPVVCADIVDEYRAVLSRPKLGLAATDVGELLQLLGVQARWVQLSACRAALRLPDPADWPVIGCAAAAQCPVITGNLKHFPAVMGVEAMTARTWVDRYG